MSKWSIIGPLMVGLVVGLWLMNRPPNTTDAVIAGLVMGAAWSAILLAQWPGRRRRKQPTVTVLCMPQSETWTWPDHLGAKTAGYCDDCKEPIFFEVQNSGYRTICYRCDMGRRIRNYQISPRELKVILDVFAHHIGTLTDVQLEMMSHDPMDIVVDLRAATILSVTVTLEETGT